MFKVKIFSDSDEATVQRRINEWLQKAGAMIVVHHVLQSESTSENIAWSLTISIFYTLTPAEPKK